MNRVPVTDAADPRLSDYVALRDTSLRKSLESERGLFIAEGEKVIRRAIEAGHRPRSFLLAERWIPGLADLIDLHPDAPVYVVSEDLADKLRQRIAASPLPNTPPITLAASFGVVEVAPAGYEVVDTRLVHEVVAACDGKLYAAKRSGRNCVV